MSELEDEENMFESGYDLKYKYEHEHQLQKANVEIKATEPRTSVILLDETPPLQKNKVNSKITKSRSPDTETINPAKRTYRLRSQNK